MSYDIIIVGGNLVGATCAVTLAKSHPNFKIGLIEPNYHNCTNVSAELDSRVYAISPQNYQKLYELNTWPKSHIVGQIVRMDVTGNKGNIIYDAIEANRNYLAKMIESNKLLQAIYLELNNISNIDIINHKVNDIVINDYMTNIILDNNITYNTRLCIAADGANSLVRNKLNITAKVIDYQQYGIVANFECKIPHHNTAYQWFLPNGDVLAFLPLYKNNQISIVWSSKINHIDNLNNDGFANLVAKTSEYKLGELKVITNPKIFPLKLSLLDKLYTKGVVFIGDSGHTVHPLAGLGVNLGFADIWDLDLILKNQKSYQLNDISLLKKYHAKRIVKIREIQLLCHTIQRGFAINTPLVSAIRDFSLNLLNHTNFAKNAIIKLAVNHL